MILDTFICVRCLLFKHHVPCGGKEKIIILAQSREVPKTYAFLPGTTLKKCCLFLFHNLGPCDNDRQKIRI